MLEIERTDGIATLRLARPPANAMNDELLARVGEVVAALASDASVRAVVLAGSDRFFSAGLDLFEIVAYDEARWSGFARAFDAAFSSLFALDVPVVAAIAGHAIAGGAVLAACADVRVMAEGAAKIGLTEIQVGVRFPTSAMEPVLFSCAGPRLREVLYRGLTYGANDALARALVDEVVPAAEVEARARSIAVEHGSRSRAAFAATKARLREEARAKIRAAISGDGDPIWREWRSQETRRSIEAYRERALAKKAR